jgi:hypothetical protein
MTSAKLLSAVEPVIRYQRAALPRRPIAKPGSPRYEQGIQQRRTRCTAWWTSGPPAKPAPRWALPPRASSTSSTRWKSRRRNPGGARHHRRRAEMKAMRPVQKSSAIELPRSSTAKRRPN